MKISIAMATYNGEKYLLEQLESIANQTRLPDELVICDDKSSDNTVEIVNDFKRKAPFEIKLFRNSENVGYIKNFEQVIEKTSGDLIFLSDQDDVWFPQKLEEVEKIFEAKPDIWLVVNDREFVNERLVSDGTTNIGRLKQMGIPPSYMQAGCCTAFRKKIKPFITPISPNVPGHDIWIHRIVEFFDKKHLHPKVLQYYRRHTENFSKIYKTNDGFKYSINSLIQTNPETYQREFMILSDLRERFLLHDLLTTEMKNQMDQKIESLQLRVELLNSSFLKRKVKAVQLLKDGHYKNFSGYKSFLKDLIG